MWKLVWLQLLMYTLAYLFVSLVYRLLLSEQQAQLFEKFILWVRSNSKQVPLTFLLGFYVSLVVKRWWEQYEKLPWPDEIAIFLKAALTRSPGCYDLKQRDEENLRIRRTVVRYCILSYVLCIRRISSMLIDNFPMMDNLITLGILRDDEADRIGEEEVDKIGKHGGSNWWLPIKWSIDIIR